MIKTLVPNLHKETSRFFESTQNARIVQKDFLQQQQQQIDGC